jgi:protein TonB
MSPEHPIFTTLVVSRRAAPFRHLPRAAIMVLVFAGYLVVVGALLLLQLLCIETMPPPKAATGPVIIFHPPPQAGGGGAGERRSGAPAEQAVTPPIIHPPIAPPTVVPLAPPVDERAEEIETSSRSGAETIGSTGDGPGGDGPDGEPTGGAGPGGGCPTCPPGTGHGGPGPDIYPDDAPGIVPPVVIPSTRALPNYPALARRALVQGSVILLIVIEADGRVGEIQVLSSPDPRFGFDLAAIEAVKQWRYRPAMFGRRPVAVQASVIVEFSLSR